MEDSYQEELPVNSNQQLDCNGNPDAAIKHRRKKNEIEKDYICGDLSCGRRYGTNAALYTHIKNKHSGIAPQGTIKPSSQQKKQITQKFDPQTNSNENQKPPQGGNIHQNYILKRNREEDERNDMYEIITSKEFVGFTIRVGKLGELGDINLLVRDSSDDYYLLKEDQIYEYFTEILQKIQMSTSVTCITNLSRQVAQFLVHASPYWKKTVIKELYFFLIYSYVMGGNNFSNYNDEIMSQGSSQNPVFFKLLQSQNLIALNDTYTNIWRQLSDCT